MPIARVGRFVLGRRLLAVGIVLLVVAQQAQAQADINNGTVRLGVNKAASLIITPINPPINSAPPYNTANLGLRYMATNHDSMATGGLTEGWSVGDAASLNWGGANAGNAPKNLAGLAFVSTATTATSTATAGGILSITHDFHPSLDPNFYEITVTVKNISPAIVTGRYRRYVDWDVEPAVASQNYVTVQGAALPGILNLSNAAPAVHPNPFLPPGGTLGNSGPLLGNYGFTVTLDLGTMQPGTTNTFNMYYGAAPTKAAALASMATLGIISYSMLEPSTAGNPASGAPNTFVYGVIPPAPLVAATGVTVTESGGSTDVTVGGPGDTYTVVLNGIPAANVVITPMAPAELVLAPTTLTFTPANWNLPQTVTVTGVHAAVETPIATITHAATSTDPTYNGIAVASVLVNYTDNTPLPTPAANGEGSFAGTQDPPNAGQEGSFGSTSHLAVQTLGQMRQGGVVLAGPFLEVNGAAQTLAPASFATAPPAGSRLRVCNVSGQVQANGAPDVSGGGAANLLGWTVLATLALVGAVALATKIGPATS